MNKKFLSLPVPKNAYVISEGWIYSKDESSIHGHTDHFAIDYACPRMTPIFASASGWAIATYSNEKAISNKSGKPLMYKEKELGYGRGFFVQIYHPATKMFTRYYHMEKVADKIPFLQPKKQNDSYIGVGDNLQGKDYEKNDKTVYVKQGEIIGFVGNSGCEWGYEAYPKRPDPLQFPSWDETHVHFKVFTREENGKDTPFDPYDIRKDFDSYPWPSHIKPMGENHIWQMVKNGLPK